MFLPNICLTIPQIIRLKQCQWQERWGDKLCLERSTFLGTAYPRTRTIGKAITRVMNDTFGSYLLTFERVKCFTTPWPHPVNSHWEERPVYACPSWTCLFFLQTRNLGNQPTYLGNQIMHQVDS